MYAHDSPRFHAAYRCWRAAPSWSHCRNGKNFEFVVDFYGLTYEGEFFNATDREVLLFGAREKSMLYFMRDALRGLGAEAFVEVGANVGHHSLFLARYAKEVHAFEPYEPVLRRFKRMVEINKIPNIHIYGIALGDESGRKLFFKPAERSQVTGSLIEGFEPGSEPYGEVDVRTGDEILEQARVRRVTLAKIDVEGFEKPVLKGLARTLKAHRPVVIFELTTGLPPPVGFRDWADVRSVLPESYELLEIDPHQDVLRGRYELREPDWKINFGLPGQYNIVAFPREKPVPRRG